MIVFVAFAAAAVSTSSDASSVQSLHVTGACIVDQMPRTARALLAMDFRSPEYAEKMKALGTNSGRCLPRRTKFSASGILFAGSIAEAFLKRDLTSKKLASHIADYQILPIVEVRSPLEEMALCTVLRDPQGTAALFQALPATPGESAAITSLAPVLGECMAKGTKAELNKPAIRSLLALAAYRIVTAPKVAPR